MKEFKNAALATLLVGLCSVSVSSAARTVSWGKDGVTRAAYDEDAIACSLPVARRDVAPDKEAKDYVRAFNVLDRENNQPPMPTPPGESFWQSRSERQVLLRRMYNPDGHVDALQAKLVGEVEACLRQRGYRRFELSKEQEKQLRRYRPGTERRRAFLFGLATDAQVVAAQQIP